MEQTIISVIVPIYKVERYLRQCVDSILNQTHSALEVILVDDGSPDGSGKICDEYAARDSRVRVIHKKNGGLSDARNAGIDIARGDYIAFVDSDDWLEPDTYESMLAAMEKYQAKLVCAGRFDNSDETGACTVGLCPEKEELLPAVPLVRKIFHWDHMDAAAWDKLYARELFREIRYPVGRVMEDIPTTYRLVLLAGGGVLLPKPVYHYRCRSGSITYSAVSERNFHLSENAAMVYEDISRTVPELIPDARYLLTCTLRSNIQTVEISEKGAKQRFAAQYRRCKRDLRAQTGFFLRTDAFSVKEKVELLATSVGRKFGYYFFNGCNVHTAIIHSPLRFVNAARTNNKKTIKIRYRKTGGNMKKKYECWIALAISFVVSLSACGSAKHVHSYNEVAAVKGKCTVNGVAEHYDCVCGMHFLFTGDGYEEVSYEDLLTPPEHTLGAETAEVKADCLTDGTGRRFSCRCGLRYLQGRRTH